MIWDGDPGWGQSTAFIHPYFGGLNLPFLSTYDAVRVAADRLVTQIH